MVRQHSLDLDLHRLHALHRQALCRENMLHLGRANAERECSKRAVRAGVRIAAYDERSRQGHALFGTDDVNDALAGIV